MANPSRDNQTQTHTKHRPDQRARAGVSRSRIETEKWKPQGQEDTPSFTERKQSDLAWARAKLPGEHPPYVTVAMDSLRLAGGEVTPGAVMDRLRASKRDRAYRVKRDREKGWDTGDDAA